MSPSGVNTNPDPEPPGGARRPRAWWGVPRTSTFTTAGPTRSTASTTAREYASSKSLSVSTVHLTRSLNLDHSQPKAPLHRLGPRRRAQLPEDRAKVEL